LAGSLAAYRAGDLLGALAQYPAGHLPATDAEKIYLAGVVLAVGQVERAEALVTEITGQRSEVRTPAQRLAEALRQMIAAVKLPQPLSTLHSRLSTATEWLAESYRRQSIAHLEAARMAAREAVRKSPRFGFGWARLAELEFSFGRITEAEQALATSLALSPRNAQAVALRGFLLSAQNKIPQAIQSFDQAIALDGALGNAWLGRGLCRIRQGHAEAGREDLQIASTLEP